MQDLPLKMSYKEDERRLVLEKSVIEDARYRCDRGSNPNKAKVMTDSIIYYWRAYLAMEGFKPCYKKSMEHQAFMSLMEDLPSFFKSYSMAFKFYLSRDNIQKYQLLDKLVKKVCNDGMKFEHPIFKELPDLLEFKKDKPGLTEQQVKKLTEFLMTIFLLIQRHASQDH
jgi:hypothetical protein